MPTAIFVTGHVPSEIGHGGNHRAYQIQHDLEIMFGKRQVSVISVPEWRRFRAGRSPLERFTEKVTWGVKLYVCSPYKVLARKAFTERLYALPRFLAHYEAVVKDAEKPTVCVIDHAGFADVLQINLRHDIPTVSCIQNLESLDSTVLTYKGTASLYGVLLGFTHELRVLAQSNERLAISKVEAGLISGFGLSCHYYAYVPVGEIRQRLEWVRRRRRGRQTGGRLFLLIGSAVHHTTRESFIWFLQNVRSRGLPSDVRIVVGGSGTEKLVPAGANIPGVELRGWVAQEELERLLVESTAVLIPQRCGFGALTRLSEAVCAGVPVITGKHSTHAIDVPPGVEVVEDSWDAWCAKMGELAGSATSVSEEDYCPWEENQPRPLRKVVDRLLDRLAP